MRAINHEGMITREEIGLAVSQVHNNPELNLLRWQLDILLDLRDQNERIIALLERRHLSDQEVATEAEIRKFWKGDRTQ